MESSQKKFLFIFAGILVGAALFVGGIVIGQKSRIGEEVTKNLFGMNTDIPQGADFSLLLRAWHLIDEKYAFDKPKDTERLWGSISGVIQSIGDPYSVFFPPKEATVFSQDIEGNFGGIGIEIDARDGILTVITPLKNSPAEKAGVRAGDKIVAINGTSTAEITFDEALLLIRGKVGEKVALKLFRPDTNQKSGGATVDVNITREIISVPTIETRTEGNTFIINLYNFNAQAGPLFEEALHTFIRSGKNKLIIDVRGNPGGYLEGAVDMASFFIPAGKPIVTEDFGKKEEPVVHKSRGFEIFTQKPKVVILVDGGTASAAEIFAAALREEAGATLVGQKTFGKGTVQELVPLTSDTFVKITVARWLTAKGESIDKNGVKPDYEIPFTEADAKAKIDPQLAKALSLLQ